MPTLYTPPPAPFDKSVLVKPLKNEIARLQAYAETVNKTLSELTALLAVLDGESQPIAPKATRKSKRRRSSDKVIKQAHGMLSDIQAAGKTGISGKELKTKWGPVFPSVKVFIQQRTGTKLKTTGARSAMKYFA